MFRLFKENKNLPKEFKMKIENEKVLVLRTIYLNPKNDELIGKLAFIEKKSKGQLIRELIDIGLENYGKEK